MHPIHELGGEMLRVSCAAAVATDEDLAAAFEALLQPFRDLLDDGGRSGHHSFDSRRVCLEIVGDAHGQIDVQPPSTISACPVTYDEASEARNSSAPASSSGRPVRRSEVRADRRARNGSPSATEFSPSSSVFENGPGRIAF